jgi:hypothetical protein
MCPLPFVGCPQSPSVQYFSTVTHLQRAQQPTGRTSSSSSLPNARFGNVGSVQQPLGRASLSSHWSIGLFNDAEVAFQCFDRCHPPGIERMHRFKNPSIGTQSFSGTVVKSVSTRPGPFVVVLPAPQQHYFLAQDAAVARASVVSDTPYFVPLCRCIVVSLYQSCCPTSSSKFKTDLKYFQLVELFFELYIFSPLNNTFLSKKQLKGRTTSVHWPRKAPPGVQ